MPLWLIKMFTSKKTWIVLGLVLLMGGLFYAGFHYSQTVRDKQELKKEVVEAKTETAAIKQTFEKTAQALNTNAQVTTKVIHDTQVIKEQIAVIPEADPNAPPPPVSPKVVAAIDWVRNYTPADVQQGATDNKETQ